MTGSCLWTTIITLLWPAHGRVPSWVVPLELQMWFMSSFASYRCVTEVVCMNKGSIFLVRQSLKSVQTSRCYWRYHRGEIFIWKRLETNISALHTSLSWTFKSNWYKICSTVVYFPENILVSTLIFSFLLDISYRSSGWIQICSANRWLCDSFKITTLKDLFYRISMKNLNMSFDHKITSRRHLGDQILMFFSS